MEVVTAVSLTKLSTTRWTARATSFQRFIVNYNQIFELWHVGLESATLDSDAKARMIGCENEMKIFEFLFGLNLGQKLFVHTDDLSKTLQGSKSAIFGLALPTKRTRESIRNTESFNSFCDISSTVWLKNQSYPINDIFLPDMMREVKLPLLNLHRIYLDISILKQLT